MKPRMIAIVCISGFTETLLKLLGMETLQRILSGRYKSRVDVHVYDLKFWKDDMRGLAAGMQRDGITELIALGYSHGAGYALPILCRHAMKRGIRVPLALLCDPVYRPQWLPRWTIAQLLSFRAIIPNSATITLPAGIRRVQGVRQDENIPRGHPVRIGAGEPFKMTLLDRDRYTGRRITHQTIDEAQEWHDLVFAEIKSVIG